MGKKSTLNGLRRNINYKKITGFLGRSDHVFGRCDKFDHPVAEFGTLKFIATVTGGFVQVTEISGRDFIELGTNVAPPTSAIVEPTDKGIDVGPTTFAANDSCISGQDSINGFVG